LAKTLTTVYKNEEDQCSTTIPKALAEAMGWERGDQVRWKVLSQEALEVRRVEKNKQKGEV